MRRFSANDIVLKTLGLAGLLCFGLWLWRDLYNCTRAHGSLGARTPVVAMGLARELSTVVHYICHPVHVRDLQRRYSQKTRNTLGESAIGAYKRKNILPIS